MKTLSTTMASLLVFVSGSLANGGGVAGVGTGSAAGTGHASSTAPAAHTSTVTVSGGHPAGSGAALQPGASFGAQQTGSTGFGHSAGLASARVQAVRALPSAPMVHNAWSDPVESRGTAVAGSRYRQTGQTNNLHVGNNLYPGAYGYVPTRGSSGNLRQGQSGYNYRRGRYRYYYNNFPYPVYYPSLYGGYGGIGYADGVGDYAGLNTASNVADLGTPDFSTPANSYYSYDVPTSVPNSAPAPGQGASRPDEPAVGPQTPSADGRSTGDSQQGPDSLVEAVQDELSKRGYFAGKSDAVYSASTKEAIRRFQTDQGLPATGRINEATLHALHLD